MKKAYLLPMVLISLVLLSSCEKNDPFGQMMKAEKIGKIEKTPLIELTDWPGTGCGLQTFELMAGKTMYAGTVEAMIFEGSIYVRYLAADGWDITEAHLFVGADDAEIPQGNSGNPKIGHFPYFWDGPGPEDELVFSILLDDLDLTPEDCFKLAAHAVVKGPGGEETAWAKDAPKGVFALKSRMDLESFTSYVMTGVPGDWNLSCDHFTYHSIEAALAVGYVDLVYFLDGSTVYGKVTVEEADGILTFTITSNAEDGLVYDSYLYTGTVDGFNAVNTNCDSYQAWLPALHNEDGVSEHVFEVPVVTTGTAMEFLGKRWGWTIQYCPICN